VIRTWNRCVAAAFLFAAASVVVAQSPADPILVVEHWSERDPLVADGTERPLSRELIVERLLDEAQAILSGMIYGYRFEYTPSHPDRDVVEQFSVQPYQIIERGDPALKVFQTWTEKGRLYARIFYTLGPQQLAWQTGWLSGANRVSSGVGTSPFIAGPTTKLNAFEDGLRMAVRNYLRTQTFNRPRRATGAILVKESPTFRVLDGNYEAHVEVLLQIDTLDHYDVF
jgi:hypothetical protein